MVEMSAVYKGNLRCEVSHGPSGSRIETDAPKDNLGSGERFSPTDLVGAALASCALTTMAIFAKRHSIAMEGARAEVVKEMVADPLRRIGSLPLKITLPKSLLETDRQTLENAARTCPVHKSLHPNVKAEMTFIYE